MGSVLTPLIVGLDGSRDLPNACTLNGRCAEVCPVQIPLPELLLELRHQQHQRGIVPPAQRRLLAAWGFVARRPWLHELASRIGARLLRRLGGTRGRLARVPLLAAWTAGRELPAPQGATFHELWRRRR
jgi:L-lactate dehydrogenase complex protein LldF